MTTKVLEAMKKAETTEATAQIQLALTKTPKEEGEKVILNIETLPPEVRTNVVKWYHQLNTELANFGKAGLQVGKTLREAREYLKPLGIWLAFLNRIPGMSLKTGDRLIKRFEMANKTLSETVLNLTLVTGIQMAGETEKDPYGRYTRAVKKVGNPPKETGDPEKDQDRAGSWLSKVLTVYNKQLVSARKKAALVDPVDRASIQLVKGARRYVKDPEGQVDFITRVVKESLKLLGLKEIEVPRPVGKVPGKKPVGRAS